MSSAAKVIKVTSTNKGEAPDWVKNAWLGCIMPSMHMSELPPHYAEQETGGYFVRQDIAMTVLRKKLPSAALWYSTYGHPKPGKYFHFPAEEVLLIGVAL